MVSLLQQKNKAKKIKLFCKSYCNNFYALNTTKFMLISSHSCKEKYLFYNFSPTSVMLLNKVL